MRGSWCLGRGVYMEGRVRVGVRVRVRVGGRVGGRVRVEGEG